MESVKVLAKKSVKALKAGGVKEFSRRVKFYKDKNKFYQDNEMLHQDNEKSQKVIRELISSKKGEQFMDVLFINGCYLPHPSRYRVSHQREQLLAGNVVSDEIFYTELSLEMVRTYRVFVFYRCPYTETIGEFIAMAKQLNKKVLFDVDDLVIDKKYTDTIKYVSEMKEEEKAVYDEGVVLMGKTLRLCDAAITTTERLAEELKNYVPEVYINRNVASDRMAQVSEWAVYDRDVLPYKKPEEIQGKTNKSIYEKACKLKKEREKGGIRLGYFSGSITHNEDFLMILPVIKKVMQKYKNLELWIVGELDIPEELKAYQNRVICNKFVNWEELPRLIASVDINLAPLEKSVFNEAKSENKWVEAALVKVPTIASKVGAFERMIQNEVTGILCDTKQEWETALISFIENKGYRRKIAKNAYEFAKRNCVAIYTAYGITQYIRSKMTPNIVFVLPTLQISGGVLVALKHCEMLHEAGMDVAIFNDGYEKETYIQAGIARIPVISRNNTGIHGSIDKAVATLYSTVDFLTLYPNIKERFYFVQNFETNFYMAGEYQRFKANQTYFSCMNLNYITISKWCQEWLKKDYGKEAKYAPNGIDSNRFRTRKRKLNGKIRILVEGNSDDYYKNVDESFRIIEKLDKKKYEVWYMSYQGKPKDWYRVTRFLHKVPNHEVAKVYEACDILLKTSILESFSYPPLEMMATGGYVIAVPNEGNIEYLKNGENCLFYSQGNIPQAIQCLEKLCNDVELQNTLYKNGIETAKQRNWELLQNQILNLYELGED